MSTARIAAVQDEIATIAVEPGARIVKNEVVFVRPSRPAPDGRAMALKAEVLRVRGREADIQVYESTRGVAAGDPVDLTGALLSAELGPGLLGTVFDGLQNPLAALADDYGVFLPQGAAIPALDPQASWAFRPAVRSDAIVRAGDILGEVDERRLRHLIFAPFDLPGAWRVGWIEQRVARVTEIIGELIAEDGARRPIRLAQSWPVRRRLPERLIAEGRAERLYPDRPLATGVRIVDTLFPVARGGTACIPGPFGAGKTVLQGLIARYSDVDVVVYVACGERAGEVVEMIEEFSRMPDPHTGGLLIDRTVIVCNTSAMPVAAREASIYTGVTIAEYYRQMGLDVLLLADSTSRWAQAMRETSGRLEEIPGEEAFPAYLDSAIRGLYERAGVLRTAAGATGALTLIGAVSPAGGNFDEPVTRATLSTVKAFLGLSAQRAYARAYPAIDPLRSWSRYGDQLAPWFAENLGADWPRLVADLAEILARGDAVAQMIRVAGEEGVSLADVVVREAAKFLDAVYLQQDAFDAVDAFTPLPRQAEHLRLALRAARKDRGFTDKAEAQDAFARLTSLFKSRNYAPPGSDLARRLGAEIEALLGGASTIAADLASERP